MTDLNKPRPEYGSPEDPNVPQTEQSSTPPRPQPPRSDPYDDRSKNVNGTSPLTGLPKLPSMSGKTMGIIAVVLVLVMGLGWYVTKQSVLSQANDKQASLSADYANGANYLARNINLVKQTAGVATANAKAYQDLIGRAIARQGEFATATTPGALIPILTQQWPDPKAQSDLFVKVADVIIGSQDDFTRLQTKVLDNVRSFNSWRTGSWKVRTFGGNLPNENLYVSLPGVETLTGMAALNKIRTPIINTLTSQAYQTGINDVEDPFATSNPVATATP